MATPTYRHSIQELRHIERCCAGVNDFQQERADDAKAAADMLEIAPQIIEEVLDAQADLQTALGIFRLDRSDLRGVQHPDMIENRLVKSLARQHRLLATLGMPMYQPATHAEIPDARP